MEELSKLSVRELKGRLMAHGVSEDEVHTYKEKPDLVQACLEHEQRQAGAKAKTQRTKMSRVHAFALIKKRRNFVKLFPFLPIPRPFEATHSQLSNGF